MTTPPQHRHALILFLSLALFTAGCAATRPHTPAPEIPAEASVDRVAVPSEETPHAQVYRLIRRSFLDARSGHRTRALASLDSASTVLASLFISETDALSPQRLSGLVRTILELYHDLLPETVPVEPEWPLAALLDCLPRHIVPGVENHPYYPEFWVRKLAGVSDVPIDYTPEVEGSIRFFQTEGRETFERWLSRSGAYLPMIREVFRNAGLPQDLAYKAMIESGFNPRATSRARAVGMWQFVRHTATLYGLRRNFYVDERRDPEKSTRAAARHVHYLYTLFEDWRLAIAAYNCGQGRLNRAIRKSGTRDFWKIDSLPKETRNHLPRFMAVVVISKAPERFGFDGVVYQQPVAYDRVPVSEPVGLRVAAICAGTTYDRMQELNPELRRGYTPVPPVHRPYNLRVPAGTADRFKANYARVPNHKKIQMVDYRVQYGDTVSEIARALGVRTRAILDANGIRNPKRVRSGSLLKIPIRPGRKAQASQTADGTFYTVKRGDTLWDIARTFRTSVDALKSWNGIRHAARLRTGTRLLVRPEGKTGAD